MATLNSGTALTGSITITKRVGTLLTLATDDKYVDKDIQFTIDAQSAAVAGSSAAADADVESTSGSGSGVNISDVIGTKTTTQPSSGYYLRVKATGTGSFNVTTPGWIDAGGSSTSIEANETLFFPVTGGTASVSGNNTVTPSASLSGSNVSFSNTNNGVSVTATGGGTASASATATTTAAGYVPNNTQIGSATINASNASTTASSFISGVTLQKPATGNITFAVTIPSGAKTETLTFNVYANGNVIIS